MVPACFRSLPANFFSHLNLDESQPWLWAISATAVSEICGDVISVPVLGTLMLCYSQHASGQSSPGSGLSQLPPNGKW